MFIGKNMWAFAKSFTDNNHKHELFIIYIFGDIYTFFLIKNKKDTFYSRTNSNSDTYIYINDIIMKLSLAHLKAVFNLV